MSMDLADRLRSLATRTQSQLEFIQTEEATKNALVMPFIAALGYDVFNPTEVTPELNADVGIKKGEKVDYAILKDGKPIILFECKSKGAKLSVEHASQLHRYFHVTSARFGILTNGIQYRFYTDLEKPNAMDSLPFFEFDLFDLKDHEIEEIKKFAKPYFDESSIVDAASGMKYTRELKRMLQDEFNTPSLELIRLFAGRIYSGRLTQNIIDTFGHHLTIAYQQMVSEQINERLQTALDSTKPPILATVNEQPLPLTELTQAAPGDGIVTTAEEIDAYLIVKSILREVVDVSRIIMRDVQSYCGVLLDDNNRKPIIRLYLDRKERQIGLFDNDDRREVKVKIDKLDDIYKFADRITVSAINYDAKPAPVA